MEKLFNVPIKLGNMYLRGDAELMGPELLAKTLSTNTYFGCFPCEVYAENTTIKKIRAYIKVRGKGKINLLHFDEAGEKRIKDIDVDTPSLEVCYLPASLEEYHSGIIYIQIEGSMFISEIWYEGEGEEKTTRLSIIICTYHREEQVLKNLQLLNEAVDSDIEIICVDNGNSITNVPDSVRLIKNPNFGGSGGYARGMMEAEDPTHFWLMDDDIRLEPVVIQKGFTFIKYRKNENINLAAGMFTFENPTLQTEATAVFDGYTFHSNASGLDFAKRGDLLKDKIEQNSHTYGGWWSLIIPTTGELPMPFFIKLDDVEYGLRLRGKYVVLPGFGVWHEAFGKKGNAWNEYYTTRNTLIIQSMYPELDHNPIKMMAIRLLKGLAYNEPKCMDAVLKGVEDFAGGTSAFMKINPEKKHIEIVKTYGAPLASDMTRKKMLAAAVKNCMKPKNWRSIGMFFNAIGSLKSSKCDTDWEKMKTVEFWKAYLGLERTPNRG